ncbi:amino acid adenylation domain-containing protein [Streptomyces sp. NBC_00536]|uniref:non-ribosomal peptide synthetase n=1 Tax=Streptomyces sp. NBC_00536 TaxID=2975769 RepID=UPI002E80A670|nr:amino acid adenylation domain-containing protein [Streptomyces sp. NBC_00536]WUC82386.1 amino acid adenylation domain-containing protein [Streptomyces sp. NBC_00536]
MSTTQTATAGATAADTARRIAELSPDQRARLEARLRERLARRPAAPTGVPRRTAGGPVPLSFTQEQIWLAQQIAPESAAYNVPMAVTCSGPLDAERLARAFRTVITRHEVLRTTFAAGADGSPVQLVHDEALFALPVTDLRTLTADEAEARVRARLAQEANVPFDLAAGPLLRAALLRTGDQEHVLSLTIHHIASDAWSVNVLLAEAAAAYRLADGPAGAALPPLPVQYGDFAAWQRGRLEGTAHQESLGYWQQRLSGLTDTPPPATATGRPEGAPAAGTHTLELPARVAADLRALAAHHRTTLFTVSLAALQVLLHRYGGGADPVIATPVGGRGRSELEGLIGCFVNTLLLRGDLSPRSAGDAPGGDPTFAELLERATASTRRDFQHQEVPFEQLAAQLRAGSPDGLARTMLVLDQAAPDTAGAAADAGELVLRPLDGGGPADAKRDLTFTVSETGDTLTLTLVHRTDRYEERSAERLLAHYATLLREAATDPHRPVGRLPLLTSGERTLLLDTWNATALAVPAGTFHGRFAEQAARTPDAVAVTGADGTHRYAALDRLANRLAHHLRALGVDRETPVGICLERGSWTVVALLAVLKAGGCYVPVDPAQPQERMAMMLADTAAPVVITRTALADRLPAGVRAVTVEELALDALPDTAPDVSVDPGQAAYVLFTSGSTGRPKGVVVEHRQVLNYHTAVVSALGLEPAGYAMVQPFTFDSCVTVLSSALLGGGTLHMVDADTAADGRLLAAYFAEHAIDYLKISPSHLAALEGPGAVHRVLPRRGLILGGEGSTSAFVRDLLGRAECEVLNHYGPTETTVGVTTHRPRAAALAATTTVPIGRPLGNVRAYVLDGRGEPVPVGVPGELFIGGAQVTRGYLGRPGLTAEKFVPDPTGVPGARMYRTGDLTRRLPDGAIEFLGRLDDQVKIRGFRIELGEVEAALAALAALAPVAAAAAVVREDRPGDRQLVGYLVPLPGATLEPADLRRELARSLPGYMVPSALVVLDALPLTAHNKLDRRALPAPPRQEAEAGRAPRDDREAALCRIFAEVLGAEREPGIDESFFDLGGHSLLAMRLVAVVRAELGAEVGVRDLFEAPTVAALAERLNGALPAGTVAPLVRAERPDVLPLSFAQRRLRFLNGMEGEASAYAMPVVLRLTEAVDAMALQAALDDVVERHETLRTVFPETGGELRQVIVPAAAGLVPLSVVVGIDEGGARERIAELSALPFDLASELPLRAALFTLAAEEHLLVLVLHHIAGDGLSMRPLTEDLTAAYEARSDARTPDWAPLAVQYADFALWQHEHLGDPDTPGTPLNRQLAHWTAELDGLPEEIALPADHSRPAQPTHRARVHTTHTDAAVHEQLTAHARAHQATLFHSVHAALAVLLTRNGAGTDVPIGTPTAGRAHRDLDQLIGFFVNTLVLRTDTSGNPTHTELLRRTRDVNLTALSHQDVPFERLVEALNPTRTPHRHPLFQTILTLNSAPAAVAEHGTQHVEFESAAKFDLSVTVTEQHTAEGAPAGLGVTIEYAADLFEPATIARLADQFQRILRAAAAHPDTPLHAIDLLGESGRAELAALATGAVRPLPAAALPELFAAQVARTPDATAVVCGTGTLSYAQLDTAAGLLARHLVALGAGAESRVALLQERSAELVVSTLAVVRAGSAYVPLSESWPDERMALVLADTGADVLLVDAATRDLPFVRARAAAGVRVVDVSAPLPDAPDRPVPAVQPDQLAYVMYTSGSTGAPKGVAVTHADVAALAADGWWRRDGHHERVLFHSPQAFDAATYELWVPLLSGGQVVVAPAGDLDPERIGRLIATYRITALWLTAGLFRLLAEDAPQSLTGVREVMTGGDVVPAAAVRRVLAAHPGLRVVDGYGPTETTVFATRHPITAGDALGSTVPIGRPLDNMRVQVLDPSLGQVPPGVAGELFIAGAGLARGYLGRPGATAERFVPDPFGEPGGRMYRTGDLGRWVYDERGEGRLEFLGRTDDQIKLRGFRIEPAEIEAYFTSRVDIAQAAVLLREDNPGDQRLVAYLVPAAGAVLPEVAELRAEAAAQLPAYLVPSALVVLETLPLTPNGKLDRRALPVPAAVAVPASRAARTPREEVLCGLFATALAVEHVGIDDNFFDLGGHSLLAMRLVAAVRAELGAEVGVRDLFEAPTVAALAERLGRALPATALAPLVRTEPRPARVPLSFAQARLWFLNRMEETERASYNIPVVLRLTEAVDAVALQAALDDVVGRHETLRTVFPETGGEPCQVIVPAAAGLVPLSVVGTDEGGARERIAELSALPFDLASELPLRAALFALAPEEHLLVLVLHHIAGDGLSMRPLTEDLTAAYEARSDARTPDWAPLAVQYADFALWQHEHLGDPDTPGTPLNRQLAHWTAELDGLPEEIALPADHSRPAQPTHRARVHTTYTDASVHEQLTAHARAHQATLFHSVHAALAVLLTRNGAGTDVPIGTPTAGRAHRDLDQLIGFFVNTLVLRTDTSGNPTHTELLRRTRDVNLTALSHQDVPFERLVEALNPTRTPHRHPLFQTILTFNNAVVTGADPVDTGTDVASESAAKFDLSVTVTELHTGDGAPAGLGVTIEYAADLFEPATIARLAEQFQRILCGAAAHPDTPLNEIDLLAEHERKALFGDWNGPSRALPGRTLPELFAAQVARTPDATAVVCDTGTLSYAQLDTAANRLARHLVAQGAGPERLVALAVPRSVETLVAVLAVLKSGAAYLPVDLTHPGERIAYTLADARPLCVVTTTGAASRLPVTDHPRLLLDAPDTAAALAALPDHDLTDDDRSAPLSLRNPAYVIYTSGSTGRPKGVVVEHYSLDAYLAWAREAYGSVAGRALVHSPVSFDLTVTGLFAPLTSGGTVQLIELDDQAPTAGEFDRPTFVKATPSHLALLTALPERFSPSEQLVLGGESLMGDVLDEWRRKHPGATVINEYGPTETTVGCTEFRIEPGDTAPSGVITIGRPIWNTRMYALDEALRALPVGVGGELFIAGDLVTRGYLGRPGLTAERFVPDPFGEPGGRMYRTGDLGRWVYDERGEGRLEFLGRTDDQIKLRGFRIEPAEIEAYFTSRADIAQAAVLLREDNPGDQRLVAYLVPAAGAVLPEVAELRAEAAAQLPAYLLPSALVVLETLPLTPNGKLDRRALPVPAAATVPASRAARTPREEVLCGLFATALAVEHVGIDDNFFDLGGHSLLAARLTARVREELGVQIGLRALFETPTVALLAERIDADGDTESSDGLGQLLPLRTGGARQPLFAVHPGGGLGWCYSGLARHLDRDRPLYALQARGLDGAGELPGSVPEMAADYLRLIRAVQPAGPYHLLGWSFGGTVAHELARQLQEAGEEVALLAMLDSHPTGRFRHAGQPSEAEILSLALDGLDLEELDALATAAPADGADALGDGLPSAAAVLELLRERGSVLGGLDPAALDRLVKVTANNLALAQGEEPGRYRGPVLFFEALPGRGADGTPLAELWAAHVDGPVENHPLDIPHSRFTTPEALAQIGPVLAAHLR